MQKDLPKVKLVRDKLTSDDDGQTGKLYCPGGTEFYTLEPPHRKGPDGTRLRGRSCIAPGTYECLWTPHATHKKSDGTPVMLYMLQKTPDADGVLIHAGNFAGDIAKGRISDSEACILLGRAVMQIEIPKLKRETLKLERKSQLGLSSSRDALAAFHAIMEEKPFELTIEERQ